jgi:hypothetical protein
LQVFIKGIDKYCRFMKYSQMSPSAAIASTFTAEAQRSRTKQLLVDLAQMSRVSTREEGLLNHVQAAAVLEVSARRVGELVELGKLTRYDFLGRTYVSVREVLDRREADVKAGRPNRSVGQRIRAAAKIAGGYDPVNAAIDAITPQPKKRKEKRK